MAALDALPERTLFVGDSDVDFATAQNAGLACVLCAWGYRPREVLAELPALAVIDSPAELARVILE